MRFNFIWGSISIEFTLENNVLQTKWKLFAFLLLLLIDTPSEQFYSQVTENNNTVLAMQMSVDFCSYKKCDMLLRLVVMVYKLNLDSFKVVYFNSIASYNAQLINRLRNEHT